MKYRLMTALLWTGLALTEFQHTAKASDWPQWRGPQRNAVSPETGLLATWPEGGPKLDWHKSGVGSGYASLAVSGGRLFTLGKRDEVSAGKQEGENPGKIFVTALNAGTGEIAWSRQIGMTSRIPCSTPTADGDRVYVLDPDGHLFCLRADSGDIVWQTDFVKDFAGRKMSGRGFGESPLIDGEHLICTPGGADAAMVALDKRTGVVIWKSKLPKLGPAGQEGAAFASIVISEGAGVRQYVQLMGRGLVSVAAADGRFLWNYNDISNNMVNIPTPVVRDDFVFAANGYNAGSVLLRLVPLNPPGTTVRGVKTEVVWQKTANQFQNHHGGVVLVGKYLYGGHGNNNGLPSCLDFAKGKILWKRRGPGVGSAAVAYADDRLYFRYQNGLVVLLEVSPEGFEVRGKLQIPGAGGDSWSHPVIANGRLYLREQNDLWVYDLRHSSGAGDSQKFVQQTATNDPALVALKELGIFVEPLPITESITARTTTPSARAELGNPSQPAMSDKFRRLYSYATKAEDKSGPPSLVILSDQHLTPEGTFLPATSAALRNFSTPCVLNLTGTRIRDDGLKQLQDIPVLTGLNLEFCNRITDAGLAHLQSLRSLRVLILTGTPVTHAGVKQLLPLKNLLALDLELCDGITDTACEPLGEMRQLRAMVLKKTGFEPGRISVAGLKQLQNLTQLELLNLYGNNFVDTGLASLQQLQKLRELDLSLLAITDAALIHLRPLRELRQLDLLYSEGFAGPKITDRGVSQIAELSTLTSLNLTGARVTDKGLEELRGLKKLANLEIVRTLVTASGISKLESALPNCRIAK